MIRIPTSSTGLSPERMELVRIAIFARCEMWWRVGTRITRDEKGKKDHRTQVKSYIYPWALLLSRCI